MLAFPLEIQYPDQVTAHPKVMLLIRLTRPKYTGAFAMVERNGAIPVPPGTWGVWEGVGRSMVAPPGRYSFVYNGGASCLALGVA